MIVLTLSLSSIYPKTPRVVCVINIYIFKKGFILFTRRCVVKEGEDDAVVGKALKAKEVGFTERRNALRHRLSQL